MFFDALKANWWVFVLRGVCGLVFGALALLLPDVTFATLVWIFGAYAFVDGAINIVCAVRKARAGERWGALLAAGVVGLAVGAVTVVWPAITALALLAMIALWAITIGVLEVIAAVRLRKEIQGEWLLGLSGIASIAFGAVVLFAPGAGALAIAVWVGVYAILIGSTLIGLGVRLRMASEPGEMGTPAPTAV